jgi:hypothetical protein
MNVLDAAYNTVHDYRGGAEALAPRIGVSSGQMLRNKVNPNQEGHHLTLREAVKVVELTEDPRIPAAFASLVGCVLVPVAQFNGISDMHLLETYTQMMKELGDFSQEFHKALQDGRITAKEISALKQQMSEFQAAGAELIKRAEQLVEPAPGDRK